MLKSLQLYCLLGLITLLATCKKTNISDLIDNNPIHVTATVSGRVINSSGNPIQGAIVIVGQKTTITDATGQFRMDNAMLLDKRAYVTVEKEGFFKGSRTFFARSGQVHFVEIELLSRTIAGTIDATTGGTINVPNGSSITLPANGVVIQSSNAVYTGTVQVAMAWVDPSAHNMYRQMPGDLRGIDENGNERGLVSYGMLAVELTGAAGQKLQVANGKKASLQFPLPASMQTHAPSTIPLWWFDENIGLWKMEGAATKSGNAYTAEVSHFTWWNCDLGLPMVQFSATFKDQSGVPVINGMVRISMNNLWVGFGRTDSTGYVTGLMPKNEPLLLELFSGNSCTILMYSQNIGPFSNNVNLGTIPVTLPPANTFTLTGTAVSCNGNPVTDGYIQVLLSGVLAAQRALINNGSFSISFNHCNITPRIEYFIVDNLTGQQSLPVQTIATSGTVNLGTISACGLSVQRFITLTFNGTTYNFVSPQDTTSGFYNWPSIMIYGTNSSGTQSIGFDLVGPNTTGSFKILNFKLKLPGYNLTLNPSPDPLENIATINEHGPVSNYMAGGFNGNFTSPGTGSTLHNLQCNFRVRRERVAW